MACLRSTEWRGWCSGMPQLLMLPLCLVASFVRVHAGAVDTRALLHAINAPRTPEHLQGLCLAALMLRALAHPCCCLAVARCMRREHAQALKAAADEWQVRHGVERILTCGFLSGGQPIVDLYELKVR